MHVLTLNVLDRDVRVACADPAAGRLLAATYGSMQGNADTADLEYTVRRVGAPPVFRIDRAGRTPLVAGDDGALLALFDADIAIELQRRRPDLYFVHSAVLEYREAAVLLVARSGGGKSTLCWALLHHWFRYLSDELGPVDPATLDVHPYLRALTLKRDPPAPYPAASASVRSSRGLHVPIGAMRGGVRKEPAPVAAVFFLQRAPAGLGPSVRRISGAEAAARLYANTLNPLAHEGEGIDAAIRIAGARPCFELVTAGLAPTCALVTATLEQAV